MRYSDFYGYRGRTFVSFAAAESARRIGKWFKDRTTSKGKPSKLTQKLKQAFPQSFTKTKTKTEEENSTAMSTNPTSKKYLAVNSGLPKLRRTTKNAILYRDQFQYELSWKGNEQKYYELYTLGTREQWLLPNATDKNRSDCFYASPFDLNPNQYVTGSEIVQTNPGTTSDWAGMSNSVMYMDFLNMTNLPCFVKLHWFKAKTSNDNSPLEDYASSILNNQLYDTQWTFPVDGTVPTVSGGERMVLVNADTNFPTTAVTVPYTNLMSRNHFTTNWKKLKTHTFGLAMADSHRLTISHNLNMFQSKSRVTEESTYPKHTLACVIEFQGAGSHVLNELTGDEGPTLAPGKVSVVITRKVNFKQMKATNERFDLTYVGKGTVIQGSSVPAARIIGDVDIAAGIIGKVVT